MKRTVKAKNLQQTANGSVTLVCIRDIVTWDDLPVEFEISWDEPDPIKPIEDRVDFDGMDLRSMIFDKINELVVAVNEIRVKL